MLGPLLARWRMMQGVPDRLVAVSSSIRLEHRTRPQPHVPTRQPPVKPRPQTRAERHIRAARAQIVLPHIRPAAHGTPVPLVVKPVTQPAPREHTAIEKQTKQFEKAIAEARAAQDPLRVTPATPAARTHYRLDMQGQDNPLRTGEGLLVPVKSWKEGGYDYYYVDYSVVFSDGTRDAGRVPWPIRYLPKDDPFANNYRGKMPLPAPLPGWTLAPDLLPLNPTLRPYFPNIYPNG
ncbi:MAG: hypothetical protein M3126_01745 [Candidatus Eremiobacteraeota bacterium]|nr:hypothetical protein [Candidatus Eremiobacteraeota bacterium]